MPRVEDMSPLHQALRDAKKLRDRGHDPLVLLLVVTAAVSSVAAGELVSAAGRSAALKGRAEVTDADRKFWSFCPLAKAPPPKVNHEAWCLTPVDRFIRAKLEAKGIDPAPTASKQRLIRRVYFDLLGLPPTPRELESSLKDESPDWYETLVDRLLANPHFGERWARHWLDVARYADSDGYEADADRPGMYHYRDFVIRAFNDDLPFDTFVKWQLAGDEYKPDDPRAVAATGFCTAGPVSELKGGEGLPLEIEQYRYDELDDIVSTTGSAFLGLTVACARCHDHKYDPIPTKDYYRLIAAFTSSKRVGRTDRFDQKLTAPGLAKAYEQPLSLTDTGAEPAESWLLTRGDPGRKSERVTLGFLSVLEPDGSPARWIVKQKPAGATTTLQRRALAEWLTDVDHGAGALLARVIVNRLWQHHFGVGIVATPSDFGAQGDPPTHSELLDWLADELVRSGWNLKHIHRLILTSRTYMEDTSFDEAKAKLDPDDHSLWRRRPMRLEAEALRDAILACGGKLDLKVYGPAIKPALPPEVMAGRNKDAIDRPAQDGPGQWRRSIYLFTKRSLLTPMMDVFDAPCPSTAFARRSQSTVPTQALILMDSAFVRRQAELFGDRCITEGGSDERDRLRLAYRIALSREPTDREIESDMKFLAASPTPEAMTNLCHVLLTLNEFAYVD